MHWLMLSRGVVASVLEEWLANVTLLDRKIMRRLSRSARSSILSLGASQASETSMIIHWTFFAAKAMTPVTLAMTDNGSTVLTCDSASYGPLLVCRSWMMTIENWGEPENEAPGSLKDRWSKLRLGIQAIGERWYRRPACSLMSKAWYQISYPENVFR
jgi:hypothetical protein